MCKVLQKFTEGKAGKSTVNFAFSGYADVIKYKEKPTFCPLWPEAPPWRIYINVLAPPWGFCNFFFEKRQMHGTRVGSGIIGLRSGITSNGIGGVLFLILKYFLSRLIVGG